MKPNWKLIWSDEFDGGEVDLSKWNILDCPNGINNDMAYMAPHNVWVEDGCLMLRQQKESYQGFQYTSGKVNTFGKFSFMYGRVELRAKPPVGKGLHTALWTMLEGCTGTGTGNVGCQWPPEIDFVEVIGQEPNIVHFNYHYGHPGHLGDGVWHTLDFNATDAFHVYAVEWEPAEIRWYMDGKEMFRTSKGVEETSTRNHILILDTTIGGDWPGDPDNSTPFPSYNYIDYVRVSKDVNAEY